MINIYTVVEIDRKLNHLNVPKNPICKKEKINSA